MSHDFDFLCRMVWWMKALAVALSVFNGVGGCGCPSSSSMYLIGLAVCALWKRAAVSASAALDTTCLIVLHSVRSGPFDVITLVLVGSGPKKK